MDVLSKPPSNCPLVGDRFNRFSRALRAPSAALCGADPFDQRARVHRQLSSHRLGDDRLRRFDPATSAPSDRVARALDLEAFWIPPGCRRLKRLA